MCMCHCMYVGVTDAVCGSLCACACRCVRVRVAVCVAVCVVVSLCECGWWWSSMSNESGSGERVNGRSSAWNVRGMLRNDEERCENAMG